MGVGLERRKGYLGLLHGPHVHRLRHPIPVTFHGKDLQPEAEAAVQYDTSRRGLCCIRYMVHVGYFVAIANEVETVS